MERSPAWAALLAGALIVAGCGKSDRAAIQRQLQQKPVAAVLEEVSRADYKPPADGRMTSRQIESYLEVRERGDRIREVAAVQGQAARASGAAAKSGGHDAGDAGDAATADLRAAQELHRNPKEYLWVKARVLEAQTAEATRALLRKMSLGREQLIARLQAERARLTDAPARAEAARQLAELERGLQESEPVVPREVEANMRLLASYRSRVVRLQQLEERALVRAGAGGGSEAGAGVASGAAGKAGAQ